MNIESVTETDIIVIENMTLTGIGITIEAKTDDREVVVGGKENRRIGRLKIGIGVTVKIAQIGMKGIPVYIRWKSRNYRRQKLH